MGTHPHKRGRLRRTNITSIAILVMALVLADLGGFGTPSARAAPFPVAAYSFDEGGGLVVGDGSGSGNDGSVSGAGWVVGGKYGSGLLFDGVDDVVTVPDDATLRIPVDITLEAWINTSSVTGHRHFVGKNFYELSVDPSGGGFTTTFEFRTGDGWVGATSGDLTLGEWYHVAGTFDGSVIRLFVDGVEVETTAAGGTIDQTSSPFRVGTADASGDFFDGLIDEVRVYDRVLTPTEIQTDMNTPISP
jgi:hypothetical protein